MSFALRKFYTYGEGEAEKAAADAAAAEAAAKAEADKSANEKRFTQADLDKAINQRFKKEKEQNEKLIADLNKTKETAGLSQQQVEALNGRIAELETLVLSKEDLAKRETERVQTTAKKKEEALLSERDLFKSEFTTMKIEAEIAKAAGDKDTKASPQQMIMLLRNQTRLIPKDVGGKTKFEVAVDWTVNEEGETKVVQLPVKEVLKRMKETAEYMPFFETDAKGGLGGNTSGGGKGMNPDAYEDPTAYRKNRTAIVNKH